MKAKKFAEKALGYLALYTGGVVTGVFWSFYLLDEGNALHALTLLPGVAYVATAGILVVMALGALIFSPEG